MNGENSQFGKENLDAQVGEGGNYFGWEAPTDEEGSPEVPNTESQRALNATGTELLHIEDDLQNIELPVISDIPTARKAAVESAPSASKESEYSARVGQVGAILSSGKVDVTQAGTARTLLNAVQKVHTA